MTNPLWKEVLPSPPFAGCELLGLWMTSFDRPDARLLVEHLLPSLFGMNQSLSQDAGERKEFFGEIGFHLERRSPLTIVSSLPRDAGEDSSNYPWLWHYVNRCHVGSGAYAVQHAKLWAFHWKKERREWLELHVCSTNLTPSAFKNQLQAGWMVTLALDKGIESEHARQSWGTLIPFLKALGASAGKLATERFDSLIKLLGRAECPAGMEFIASFPGQKKGAARQLARFDPTEVHVLTPTVGEWNEKDLAAWCKDVGVAAPGKIHLKWIAESHPWAGSGGWSLSASAKKNLESSGVQIERLPEGMQLMPEHRATDERWGHAKLYLLRNRQKRRRLLLVTSANWSRSAWGAGEVAPSNFELGVIFKSEWERLDLLEKFPPGTAPWCVERHDVQESKPTLWAEADWDGKNIALHVRSADTNTPVTVDVTFVDDTQESTTLAKTATEAVMPWNDARRIPLIARFVQGRDELSVDVHDTRALAEKTGLPLPEVDPEQAQELRDKFLLLRYGGPVADVELESESILLSEEEHKPPQADGGAPAADYSVKAWTDARAAFGVVDKWRAARRDASDALQAERVRLDGEALRALYQRRGDVASKLVAEELSWRLKEAVAND